MKSYDFKFFIYVVFCRACHLLCLLFTVEHGITTNMRVIEKSLSSSLSGITFEELLGKPEVRLKKDQNTHVFDIYVLVQPSTRESLRMKITHNFEWSS